MGPQVWTLLLDCRYVTLRSHLPCQSTEAESSAERRKDQVCSPYEYKRVLSCMWTVPNTVEHLILQVGKFVRRSLLASSAGVVSQGVPVAYPRMVLLETALASRFNPLTALGRSGSLGLSGFVNKFNGEAELLDDLVRHNLFPFFFSINLTCTQNDHWTAKTHKVSRL